MNVCDSRVSAYICTCGMGVGYSKLGGLGMEQGQVKDRVGEEAWVYVLDSERGGNKEEGFQNLENLYESSKVKRVGSHGARGGGA